MECRARTAVVAAALGVLAAPTFAGESALAPSRRAEILHLVRQECGSCHGLRMKGGLGPPLVPEVLAAKDSENLRHVVLHGRPGTAMPPWMRFLTEAEARWVIEMLQKGLPSE
jgi:cytochrome c55X